MKRLMKATYRLVTVSLVFLCVHCQHPQNTQGHLNWGENIFLFTPQMDQAGVQKTIDSIYQLQSTRESEFSPQRFAFLFSPGHYTLDVKVGYYTQVLGIGQSPNDVVIEGGVQALSMSGFNGSVLINFWRAVENLTIIPTNQHPNIWAVSQAAPMRRVHIKGNLQLHQQGAASGGFLADSKIEGSIDFGPQQQWFSRNCSWLNAKGGLWNIVSLGVQGAPTNDWPRAPYLSIDSTPLLREKPFLALNEQGALEVIKPGLQRNTRGVSWQSQGQETPIPIADFYIAYPGKDSAGSINKALKGGKHILFTPGIYHLKNTIQVERAGSILMGIGLPSLRAESALPVLKVADVPDVTLSGLLVDAGQVKTPYLVEVGPEGSHADHSLQPTAIYDLFVRIGGYHAASTQTAVRINSSQVLLDHIWLWRADHGEGAGWNSNPAANGLVVNGENVSVYGLFNEHFQAHQTQWKGEAGKVYFYQSEMPYYVPDPQDWKHGDTMGYASLQVDPKVQQFQAFGVGIYNVFFNSGAQVDHAIELPEKLEKNIHHAITIWLGGHEESCVKSILNGKGAAVNKDNRLASW